jgi:hypothetical protein
MNHECCSLKQFTNNFVQPVCWSANKKFCLHNKNKNIAKACTDDKADVHLNETSKSALTLVPLGQQHLKLCVSRTYTGYVHRHTFHNLRAFSSHFNSPMLLFLLQSIMLILSYISHSSSWCQTGHLSDREHSSNAYPRLADGTVHKRKLATCHWLTSIVGWPDLGLAACFFNKTSILLSYFSWFSIRIASYLALETTWTANLPPTTRSGHSSRFWSG